MAEMLFTPRDAAQILGVSYPALKQWVYKRKLRTIKTPVGITVFRKARLTACCTARRRSLVQNCGRVSPYQRPQPTCRSHCGRSHQWIGGQVVLSIGGQQITSLITADAVREMGLKKGQTAAALIKATEVMIIKA